MGAFRMVIRELAQLTGRPQLITRGMIDTGRIKAGTTIGYRATRGNWVSCRVEAIEKQGRIVSEAGAGDQIGLILANGDNGGLAVGTVLSSEPEPGR
jgi:translation elongation factor EF-Tu-like GTPase